MTIMIDRSYMAPTDVPQAAILGDLTFTLTRRSYLNFLTNDVSHLLFDFSATDNP